MSTDPMLFVRETIPALFKQGLETLQAKAAEGNARAQAAVDNVTPVTGAMLIHVEDAGANTDTDTLFLTVRQGEMTVSDAAPSDAEVKFALAFPLDAAEMVLGEAAREGAIDNPRLATTVAQVPSQKLEDLLAGRALTAHLIVTGVPDLDTVTVRIGFNVSEPPSTPGFTATLTYDDLEDLRAGDINPQQLFMGGKLRMTGDYSVAMQVGMQMMSGT